MKVEKFYCTKCGACHHYLPSRGCSPCGHSELVSENECSTEQKQEYEQMHMEFIAKQKRKRLEASKPKRKRNKK